MLENNTPKPEWYEGITRNDEVIGVAMSEVFTSIHYGQLADSYNRWCRLYLGQNPKQAFEQEKPTEKWPILEMEIFCLETEITRLAGCNPLDIFNMAKGLLSRHHGLFVHPPIMGRVNLSRLP